MNNSERYEEMLCFFEEYAEFFAHMAASEVEKLQALISNELPRIEHAISVAQANAMQMESMEQRRQKMQERANVGGMTFSQIIEQAPNEQRGRLQALFARIQESVDGIKQCNGKSMDIANANMRKMNLETVLPKADGTPANAYMRVKEDTGRGPILETKV